MITREVNGFIKDNLTVFPYFEFLETERGMILSPRNGTTLFAERDVIEKIGNGNLSENMAYRLVSLGFAETTGSPQPVDPQRWIMPNFFMIDLTNACNLHCVYCLRVPESQFRSISSERLLTICKYIAETCEKHRIYNFTIQPWGGEPLTQIDRIVEIRRYFTEHTAFHPRITVQTNGTLLSEENLQKLKACDIQLGVSCDGPADIQDLQRRNAANGKTSVCVENGLRNARVHGYEDIGGICVVTNNSIGKIRRILEYAEEQLHLKALKFNLMHQPAHECTEARALDPEEIKAVCKEICDAYFAVRKRKCAIMEPNIEDRIRNLCNRADNNICHSCGCCGGRRLVSFDMDGKIYPCELTDWPDEAIGAVDDGKDLFDIIQAAINKPYFQKKKAEACDHCPWYYYCRGGCSAAVKYLHQERNSIDTLECTYNRSIYPLIVEHLLTYEH